MVEHGAIAIFAIILDRFIGDPSWLWARIPHPVRIIGLVIGWLDRWLNDETLSDRHRLHRGGICMGALLLGTLGLAIMLEALFHQMGWAGQILEITVVSIFLAQGSLLHYVGAVGSALKSGSLDAARDAVGHIVGRDPNLLDKTGVVRAGIESLAENFSDGFVAPLFWYLLFGLPGLLTYKAINTADSMIGYRSKRYRMFGRYAAILDDYANFIPARISAGLILFAAMIYQGRFQWAAALGQMRREASLHASPNAGWPETAMANACNIALGGPRHYDHGRVVQSYINGSERRELSRIDLELALTIAKLSGWLTLGFVGAMIVVLGAQ